MPPIRLQAGLENAARLRLRISALQGTVIWENRIDATGGSFVPDWGGASSRGRQAARGIYVLSLSVDSPSDKRAVVQKVILPYAP
jgi:hypothetical protein